jgi:transposase
MSNKEVKLVKKIKGILKQLNCRGYLHHFGPKKYKLEQHLFALLMMEVLRLSLRRIENILTLLGFKVPTYSALCKSRKRIPLSLWNSVLKLTAGTLHKNVAIDSTGFSRTNPSFHYIKRIDREKPVNSYVKVSSLFDIGRRKFLAIRIRLLPRHDVMDIKYLLAREDCFEKLFGDSAYDAEFIHELCFELGIQTIIKPKKRVKSKFYRRKQMRGYSESEYHQRSLIEAGQGGEKRKYGGFVLGRKVWSIRVEIYCKAIAYNLRLSSLEIFN